MKVEVFCEKIDAKIVYDENAFTGKKKVSVNGVEAIKESKNSFYLMNSNDQREYIEFKGSYLTGVDITYKEEKINLVKKLSVLEIVLSVLPFIAIMIFGNIRGTNVVGGAIGGLIGGIFCVLNLLVCRSVKNVVLKIVLSVVMLALALLVAWLIGMAIVGALT